MFDIDEYLSFCLDAQTITTCIAILIILFKFMSNKLRNLNL